MTDHINENYIKVNLSLLVYVVRGLLKRAPQVVFKTELTCLIINTITGFNTGKLLSSANVLFIVRSFPSTIIFFNFHV